MVKRFRSNPSKVFPHPTRDYTGEEIALEIEQMTEMGQNLVAVGGFVLQAMNATPEFFTKDKAD
jgi:hypothetical protein